MPKENFNAAGTSVTPSYDNLTPQRATGKPLQTQDQVQANDSQWAAQAAQLNDQGNTAGAREAAENIIDPARRITVFQQLFGNSTDMTAPGEIFRDGFTGITDPLALFFMMVVYLDKPVPQITWNDILSKARTADAGNDAFAVLPSTSDTFLTQRIDDRGNPVPPTVGTDKQSTFNNTVDAINKQNQAKLQTSRDDAAASAEADRATQAQRDASSAPMPAQSTPTNNQTKGMVVWPIQNMPVCDGVEKSVDWETMRIVGGSDPYVVFNNGADNISLDLQFTYAVGIPGIGDDEGTEQGANSTAAGDSGASKANEVDFWTAEDVMGMMYLAQSLVYPFQSTEAAFDSDGKPIKPTVAPGANQFPVVFLRHYSLFPFLTPFVVKCVKIEPDEEQPLIITNPQRLNDAPTHLSFPAVRQVVKITVSLMSAYNYITLFGQKLDGQIQQQTSGKTYRDIAAQLLGGRI